MYDFVGSWNGLNIKPARPWFNERHIDVIPSYSENANGRAVTFALPQKPFYTDYARVADQQFVVSASISHVLGVSNELTFSTPFLPHMNVFYGRRCYHHSKARSESNIMNGALGIITSVMSQIETIRAIRIPEFLKALFNMIGAETAVSEPGRVCSGLITQLGGVQGWRVLKVRGARELIRKYEPDQSFTRSDAHRIIGNLDAGTGKPRFADFEGLYIKSRDTPKLRPSDVFEYLVEKGVFRVGLDLKCPNCALKSWVHIDKIRTRSKCEYCGYDFDITPQLRDRDWRYRRSGLFGRRDEQHGSIPVALAIQQLDNTLYDRALMYSTGLEFRPTSADIESCEADFVMVVAGYHDVERPVQILLGECKTAGAIEEHDARKLGQLVKAIERNMMDAYVMFAKTGVFSAEEIQVARSLNSEHRQRVILWSCEQLEPQMVCERARTSPGHHQYATTLSDMARVTEKLFFEIA